MRESYNSSENLQLNSLGFYCFFFSLQDKGSCFPAEILNPPPGSHVLDACAAPGNKTTHLAMLMQGTGKIFAFEKDYKRFQLLQKMTALAETSLLKHDSIFNCINRDFLKIDPSAKEYSKVQYALVDPSCSGSGMITRLDAVVDDTKDDQQLSIRLKALAAFQVSTILHAMKCNLP